jgi:hypothetical protein
MKPTFIILLISIIFFKSTLVFSQDYCMYAGEITENIIYTKIQDTIPMLLWTENIAEIDLNQDGIVDFEIIRYHHQSAGNSSNILQIKSLNSNKVATGLYISCFTDYYRNTSNIFTEGELLNCNSITYKDTTVIVAYYSYTNGLGDCTHNTWALLDNSFIGVELIIEGQSYHGWIRLKAFLQSHKYRIIVYDYGMCSINSKGEKYQYDKNKIFPNPFADELIIVSSEIIRNIKILNIYGICVYETNQIQNSTINLNLSFLKTGIYFILIENDSNNITYQKVIKR